MALNSKIEQKVSFECQECGEILRRKPTEKPPHSCNYCHTPFPRFERVKSA
jgi:rubrerythrin